jgi:hypothetical protein
VILAAQPGVPELVRDGRHQLGGLPDGRALDRDDRAGVPGLAVLADREGAGRPPVRTPQAGHVIVLVREPHPDILPGGDAADHRAHVVLAAREGGREPGARGQDHRRGQRRVAELGAQPGHAVLDPGPLALADRAARPEQCHQPAASAPAIPRIR